MLKVLTKTPLYYLARKNSNLRPLPVNLTFSVSYRCNSRCKTCNVWRKRVQDFSIDEYEQTFRNLGQIPYWLTFSGGEPFLRPDLIDIVLLSYKYCHPGIINIPTNGLLIDRIVSGVERLVYEAKKAQIILNLSLDGIGEEHDRIRGVPGNYVKLRETYDRLKSIKASNLTIGIHSVISQHNVDKIIPLMQHVRNDWQPDSFITEMAEERVELDTIGLDISPDPDAYRHVAQHLIADIDAETANGVAGIAQAFRRHYYDVAVRTITEQRQILPCYAGIASGHIAPNGDVWTCCIRAEPIGNLRETGYDLGPIWRGSRADSLRSSIRAGECYCPLANASYSSMLSDPQSLAQVGWNFAQGRLRRLRRG